jgi:hypothetical protein
VPAIGLRPTHETESNSQKEYEQRDDLLGISGHFVPITFGRSER